MFHGIWYCQLLLESLDDRLGLILHLMLLIGRRIFSDVPWIVDGCIVGRLRGMHLYGIIIVNVLYCIDRFNGTS